MATAPLPAILTRPSDPHPFVAKLKARKLGDISYASERNVFDQVTLAWCLVALGREADAAAICEAIAHNVDFEVRDRYESVWGPAYSGVVLGSWLAQRRGDTARAAELEAIARRVPGKVAKPRQRAEAIRREAQERMAEARAATLRDRAFALLQAHPLEWLTAELTMPITDVPRDVVEATLAEAIACVREIVARGR
jgi:hypothetical protein